MDGSITPDELKRRLATAEARAPAAEAALREGDIRHRLLIESWAQAVWETDAAGVVVADSPSWRAYTGQTLEEWLGYGWLDAVHPDDRAYAEQQWREAMATRRLVNAEFRLRAPGGGWRWTNVLAAPMLDAAGSIEKWLGLNIDIDDRKQAETSLRESEERYRSLFESMDEAYAVVEVLKGGDGRWADFRFLEVNRAFLKHTNMPWPVGKTATELLGSPNPSWTELYGQALDTGEPLRVEEAEATLGLTFDLNIFSLDRDRNRVAVLFTNITERRQAEAALRESEEKQAFLLHLSDALRPIAEPLEIARIASRILGERLGADRVAYAEFDPDEDTARLLHEYHPVGAPSLPQNHYRWSDFDPVGHARGKLGHSFSRADVQQAADLTAAQKAVFAAVGFQALINVPLVKSGRLVAFIAVHWGQPREATAAEIGLVEETAERTWAAVERARAEEARRESERRFRQFGDALSDVLWIVDATTGQLEYLSPAFDRIWGVPRDSVMTDLSRWAAMVHPEDRQRILTALPRAIAGEAMLHEYRIIRGDGEIRFITDVGFPIFGDDGRVVRVGGIAQDLTERHQAEAAVRASERRLQLLMEGVPQLVWRAVGDGHWTWASPQWTAFTGQREADSHGLGWLQAVHPDDRAEVMQVWAGATERGEYQAEYRLLDVVEQRYCWFQTRASAVRDDTGAIVEWLGTSTDVNDLRQLQARQGVMVAELQHRTRNLITVVKAISQQTVREAASLPDFRTRFQDRLEALSRVQGLLSQITAGRRVTFDELLGSELAALGAPLDKVTLDGPADVPLRSATVQTFSLALHELATNALKYGALVVDGGHLAVRWSVQQLDDDAPRLRVDWRETGVDLTRAGDRPRGGGYGRELIENALPYQLGAKTSYEMMPDGVHCTIEVPIAAPKG